MPRLVLCKLTPNGVSIECMTNGDARFRERSVGRIADRNLESYDGAQGARLVTFPGLGRHDKKHDRYVYDPTEYEFQGRRAAKTPYVCRALAELLQASRRRSRFLRPRRRSGATRTR